MYDYETYGDSPTCLNEDRNIADKKATLQGFGKTETGEFPNKLLETTVNTITNEDCINWMRINMRSSNGNTGDKTPQLPDGINSTILCTRGIENNPGEFSVRIKSWQKVLILLLRNWNNFTFRWSIV